MGISKINYLKLFTHFIIEGLPRIISTMNKAILKGKLKLLVMKAQNLYDICT